MEVIAIIFLAVIGRCCLKVFMIQNLFRGSLLNKRYYL